MSKQDEFLEKAFDAWKEGELDTHGLRKAFLEWDEQNRKQGQVDKLYQRYRRHGRPT